MEHQEPVSHTILHKLNLISYAQRTFVGYTAPSALDSSCRIFLRTRECTYERSRWVRGAHHMITLFFATVAHIARR